MNRRVWRYAAVGLGLYVSFLIVTAPAEVLALALTRATNDSLSLRVESGTLWRGKGALFYRGTHGSAVYLGAGNWSINPLWLLAGRVGVRMNFNEDHIALRGQALIGLRRVVFRDIDIRFPANLVPAVYAASALAGPSGEVRIGASEFILTKQSVSGEVTALWRGAASTAANINPLGNYRVVARGQGAQLALTLSTDGGELNLSGQGSWSLETRRLKLNGSARPTPASEALLDPLLRLMGRDQGDGARTFLLDVSV